MSAPRVLIAAGGTGGHIFPALAVAQELKRRGWHAEWVGSDRGLESRLIPGYGIGLHILRFAGLRGKGLGAWLTLPSRLVRAMRDTLGILIRARPEVVLAFGGYVTFPVGLVARLRRIPLCIHEQNAVMGTANRWLAKIARQVFISFPATRYAPARSMLVGNPIRKSISGLAPPANRLSGRAGPIRVLVVGGSLGAQALNQRCPALLAKAIERGQSFEIRHQTGQQDHGAVEQLYRALKIPARCEVFIDDMEMAYQWADLLICRAGASTVTEVAAAGIAAIFVPLPSAIDDHQTANASSLAESGAAWLIPQTELGKSRTVSLLVSLTRDALTDRAGKAQSLCIPNATERVADCVTTLARSIGSTGGVCP